MDELDSPDIVVFLDGDFSDYPEEIILLLDPIEKGEIDFVLGSRMIISESRMAKQIRGQKWLISYLWEYFLFLENRIPIWLDFVLGFSVEFI